MSEKKKKKQQQRCLERCPIADDFGVPRVLFGNGRGDFYSAPLVGARNMYYYQQTRRSLNVELAALFPRSKGNFAAMRSALGRRRRRGAARWEYLKSSRQGRKAFVCPKRRFFSLFRNFTYSEFVPSPFFFTRGLEIPDTSRAG